MASALYAHQPMFRQHMDRCFAAFQRYSTVDLKALLFDDEDTRDIDQTQFTQPALFCVEYSLARTLIDLGITPDGMIGHSLGSMLRPVLLAYLLLRMRCTSLRRADV